MSHISSPDNRSSRRLSTSDVGIDEASNLGLDPLIELLAHPLVELPNKPSIEELLQLQRSMQSQVQSQISRCDVFEQFSTIKYQALQPKFEAYAQQLQSLQTELNSIFKRIRRLKAKLQTDYPKQFQTALSNFPDLEEED